MCVVTACVVCYRIYYLTCDSLPEPERTKLASATKIVFDSRGQTREATEPERKLICLLLLSSNFNKHARPIKGFVLAKFHVETSQGENITIEIFREGHILRVGDKYFRMRGNVCKRILEIVTQQSGGQVMTSRASSIPGRKAVPLFAKLLSHPNPAIPHFGKEFRQSVYTNSPKMMSLPTT